MIKIKKCDLKVFNFVKKLNSLKSAKIVLKIKEKEHVHNLNRRWARNALKA